jgi:3-oxoacyl-[acyl-carrier-protein] synthase II
MPIFAVKTGGRKMRRIVVTGMGAVSPLGANVGISRSPLLAGQSGIRRLPDDIVGDLLFARKSQTAYPTFTRRSSSHRKK